MENNWKKKNWPKRVRPKKGIAHDFAPTTKTEAMQHLLDPDTEANQKDYNWQTGQIFQSVPGV